MEPLIKVRNLSQAYKENTSQENNVLNSINLDIYEGQTLGLVGESGSGKTTLGKSILRLIEPTKGEVIYKGVNILNLNKEELRKLRKEIQIIFQDSLSTLNPKLSIRKILEEPFKIHNLYTSKVDLEKKVIDLLDHVQLPQSSLSKYPSEFSGGQRQRICIARAIACKPKFIVCDECVSALDVSIQTKILRLLKDLQTEYKITYFFISHNLNVVRSLSHNVAIMYLGNIVEQGQVADIFNNPKHPYTKTLLSSILRISD